eukprot:766973-Rhodomonas_salina.1
MYCFPSGTKHSLRSALLADSVAIHALHSGSAFGVHARRDDQKQKAKASRKLLGTKGRRV